jgi:hypothetical protein
VCCSRCCSTGPAFLCDQFHNELRVMSHTYCIMTERHSQHQGTSHLPSLTQAAS